MNDLDNQSAASYLSSCDEMTQAEGTCYESLDKKKNTADSDWCEKKKGRYGIEFLFRIRQFFIILMRKKNGSERDGREMKKCK